MLSGSVLHRFLLNLHLEVRSVPFTVLMFAIYIFSLTT